MHIDIIASLRCISPPRWVVAAIFERRQFLSFSLPTANLPSDYKDGSYSSEQSGVKTTVNEIRETVDGVEQVVGYEVVQIYKDSSTGATVTDTHNYYGNKITKKTTVYVIDGETSEKTEVTSDVYKTNYSTTTITSTLNADAKTTVTVTMSGVRDNRSEDQKTDKQVNWNQETMDTETTSLKLFQDNLEKTISRNAHILYMGVFL